VSANQQRPQPGGGPSIGVPIGPAQLNGQVYDIVVAPDRLPAPGARQRTNTPTCWTWLFAIA
jgi:hypothetical protein